MKQSTTYDDIEFLVQKAQKGNEEAKEELCHHFSRLIHSLSRKSLNTVERDDMTQTLWCVFLEHLVLYRRKGSFTFTSWITDVLHHKAVDYIRTQKQGNSHIAAGNGEAVERILAGDYMLNGSRQNWYVIKEPELTAEEVDELIRSVSLTPRQEEILRLHMEGIPWSSMGKICHISTRKIYKHRSAMIRAMKENKKFQENFA